MIISVAAVAEVSLFFSQFLWRKRLNSAAGLLTYSILTIGLTSFAAWVAYSVIGRVPSMMPGIFSPTHFLG